MASAPTEKSDRLKIAAEKSHDQILKAKKMLHKALQSKSIEPLDYMGFIGHALEVMEEADRQGQLTLDIIYELRKRNKEASQ